MLKADRVVPTGLAWQPDIAAPRWYIDAAVRFGYENHVGSTGIEPPYSDYSLERENGRSLKTQDISKRKGITMTVVVPFLVPLVDSAEKVGSAAQLGVLAAAKKLGVDGAGVSITSHWGIAADRAARAFLGGGPKALGGGGIASGNARLEIVRLGTTGLIVVGVVGTSLWADRHIARQSKRLATASRCENCGKALNSSPCRGQNMEVSPPDPDHECEDTNSG